MGALTDICGSAIETVEIPRCPFAVFRRRLEITCLVGLMLTSSYKCNFDAQLSSIQGTTRVVSERDRQGKNNSCTVSLTRTATSVRDKAEVANARGSRI